MSNTNFPFWQGLKKLLVDRGDGTHAERVEAYPPAKLMTDEDGQYARVRVDVGQTGFFAGREFSAFHEYLINTGSSIAIRAITTVDVFLNSFLVDNWAGSVRVELRSGSTVTSPFINDIPVMRVNNTSDVDFSYVTHVDMDNGGVVTGGNLLDVFQVNSGNKSDSVSGGSSDPIGMPAGTYYISITNIGNQTAQGVFKARWEERP
jgi:hypothetical protein